MPKNFLKTDAIRIHSDILWFLTLSYSMVIVLANWFNARFIEFWGLSTDAGTLIFPLTFMLSDLITEVYGYKYARRAIWYGFLFNVFYIIYSQIVIHMPSPDYSSNNELFDKILAINMRVIFASIISYFLSEPINSAILSKLKIKMNGRYMSIRFVLSTLVASGIDSFIFSFIAFYGLFSNQNLFIFILTMWFIKVLIEVLGLPLSITLAKKIKKAEQLDIYDKNTRFNLFSLNTSYTSQNNEFIPQREV